MKCYRANRKGRITATAETRRLMSEAAKGRIFSAETRALISERITGTKNPLGSKAKLANPPWTAEWHIRSPNGVAYRFVNLTKFVRENHELFNTSEIPDLWKRAHHGIHNLASWSRGDKPNMATHWRGWTLVSKLERHFVYGRDLLDRTAA